MSKKAVILAGGLGVRLKPFTQVIPKPLLPIGEKAILEIQIEHLKKYGFDEIFLATNYKSSYIENFLGDGSRYGVKLVVSKEEKPLGTCGPFKLLQEQLDEPFIVMNGDILSSIDLSRFFDFALSKEGLLTVAVKKIVTPYAFGNIFFDSDFVTGVEEKPDIVTFALAGIYAVKPEVFEYIPENEYFGMDSLIKRMLKNSLPVAKYEMSEYWLDLGRVDDYQKAQDEYLLLSKDNRSEKAAYKIPLFKLNFGQEEEDAVIETLRSTWISTGPKTVEFESLFGSMLDIKYSVALSNCTVALHLALRVLGIKESDEVIVPSLTFVATANAIRYVNATPIFCDITSTEDLTLDPEMIERLITKKTRAIIAMHYAGFPCDMEKIMQIAQKYGLYVIEDACHGPLSEYGGKKLGTIGDIGCFSFFSNKNISTGEGGMLITDNEEFYTRAKLLRSHGMTSLSYDRAQGHSTSYDVVDLGCNYRIDDIRASLGITQLKKLRDDLTARTELRQYYVERLSLIDQIIVPFKQHTGFVSNYILPIVLKDSTAKRRNRLRAELQRYGIQTSIHYPAVHKFSIYQSYARSVLSKTEYVADNEITLPMYSSLQKSEIDYICSTLYHILNDEDVTHEL